MTEDCSTYPVASLHEFLEEASDEFRRFRFQARLNLLGSLVLLLFILRFVVFFSYTYAVWPPNTRFHTPFFVDTILLIGALTAVAWSFDVWRRQRRFVSRWGERFEKLQAIEKKLLAD